MVTTALVVGLGAAGRRHAAALKVCDPSARIIAVSRTIDPVPHVDRIVRDIDQALRERPDIAVLAGPATTRTTCALRLAEHGIHMLLEKPVAAELEHAHRLAAAVADQRLAVAVGYNLRFFEPVAKAREMLEAGVAGRLHSARLEVGQYLPDWRPGSDYRATVSAQRALGGGALLELSHEIDYLRWIMGPPARVMAVLSRSGDLDVDVEDAAEMIITFESGAVASVHLDMLQRPAVRTARFVGDRGSVTVDLRCGTVIHREASGQEHEPVESSSADVAGTYVAQMADFLDAVASGRPPLVSLADGIGALAVVEAARASALQGRKVVVAAGPSVEAG